MTAAIAILAGSVPLLLFGLLARGLRDNLPDLSDSNLTPAQRFAGERTHAAVRMSPLLIRLGLAGISIGAALAAAFAVFR
jgi:hypothetical protein